jgi:signal transduction histidine kinase
MRNETDSADSRRGHSWLTWSLAGLSFALFAATIALYIPARSVEVPSSWGAGGDSGELISLLPFLAFPVVGALIASRRPENPIGWICLSIGIFWMLGDFATAYGVYGLVARPGSVPFPAEVGSLGGWLWAPAVGLLGTYLILLFPDGRLPSRRWLPVAWLSGAAIVVASAGVALVPEPLPDLGGIQNPSGLYGYPQVAYAMFNVLLLLPLCILASAASLIVRFRRSGSEVREQIKWIAFAASLLGLGLLVEVVSALIVAPDDFGTGGTQPFWLKLFQDAVTLSYAGIPVAVGFAVLKYRLYDIDIVINRTLVYGALTASVVAIYVLVVGYLGALFRTGGNLAISLLATGVVAVLFQPLRDRLQRGVNRLMYGERDDPYAVVSRLGERLEETLAPEAVLPTVVESVSEALKLPYAAIALRTNGASEVAASVGKEVENPLRLPLTYQGKPVGELLLGPRAPGDQFSAADRHLLEGLARQAGVAAYAVRLTTDLQRSRERLVAAREEERRRLRRNLHDGLGAQLAALNVQAGSLRRIIPRDPAAADELVVELREELRGAIADIRRLVYDLRPPALDDLGLLATLHQLAERYGAEGEQLRVVVEVPEDLPHLPAAVEVAIYRIAQEALTNVVRHAQAKSCIVRLAVNEDVALDVVDDGVGIPEERSGGVGLSSMRERAAELGGTCVIEPAPEGGTRVSVRLPLLKE